MALQIKSTIDRDQILRLLEKMMTDVGAERMSSMKLLDVEAEFRKHNASVKLPGKTVLRECINKFRTEHWPQTAPKKVLHWSR